MDALELTYEAKDKIPDGFVDLYTEKDGKFNLTNINGMKTQADVSAVQEGLRKEREDHVATTALLKPWKGMKHDEVVATLAKTAEYKLAANGKMDDDKINSIVDQRIGQKTGPLETQITTLGDENIGLKKENSELKSSAIRRDLNDSSRVVALDMKVQNTAMLDIELVAAAYFEKDETTGQFIVKADAQGVTPGLDVKGFMKEMQKVRPHWWPTSAGGGAAGAGAGLLGDANPFSAKGWNLTEQGKVVRTQGQAVAETLAKAAGTTLGGLKPTEKK